MRNSFFVRAAASACIFTFAFGAFGQSGTWTALANASPSSPETALLMTDGTVLVHDYGNYKNWYKLTPSSTLSYINGTWSQAASMTNGRLYGQTAVFKDGRILCGGGEYLTSPYTDHNGVELYNPVTNTWSAGPDSLYSALGDTGCATLADGRLIASNWSDGRTNIYDPATNAWTPSGSLLQNTGDEQTWITLADGSVLAVYNVGQRYLPSTNSWVPTATLPVNLVSAAGEIGPAVMLYNGQVLVLGGTGKSALYTPPSTPTGLGIWTAGPDLPPGCAFAGDTPCAVEVNGKVLCLGANSEYGPLTSFFEYDPAANTFTTIPAPPVSIGQAFALRMLCLPDGKILLTGTGSRAYVYTPAGGVRNRSYLPVVSSVTQTASTQFTLSGININGLTNGASYGDEANPYTNYPIVLLKDGTGTVYRCRSFNFSTMGYGARRRPGTCDFTIPSGLPHGSYKLTIVANGISSPAFAFTY